MIFFDIDGTLLDYEAAERNLLQILIFFQYNTIFSGNELEWIIYLKHIYIKVSIMSYINI